MPPENYQKVLAYHHAIRAKSLIFPSSNPAYKSIMHKKGWRDRPVDTLRDSAESDWNAERRQTVSALRALAHFHREGGLHPTYTLSYEGDNLVLRASIHELPSIVVLATNDNWRTPLFFRKKP